MGNETAQFNRIKSSLSKGIALLAPALILLSAYLIVSFLDFWALLTYGVQAAIFILLLIAVPLVTYLNVKGGHYLSDNKTKARLFLSASVVVIAAVLNGSEMSRLATEAAMPRALFDYPSAEVTVTASPPLYLSKSSVTQSLVSGEVETGSLASVYEGSMLDVTVSGLTWQPALKLSDGSGVLFEKNAEGDFVASIEIDDQTSWSIKQGNHVVGRWPLIVIDDETPKIERFELADIDNKKGYVSVDLNIEDDLKIMTAAVEVVDGGGNRSDKLDLSIREIGNYESQFYLDFTGSDLAGQRADLLVSVQDEAGQTTTALIEGVELPVRTYENPIAHKLISLYQELGTAGFDQKSTARQIKALGMLPDEEQLPPVYYMALRSADWRLVNPSSADDMETGRNLLWDIAQKIENRELGPVENELLAALDELTLAIKQKKELLEIRDSMREADRLFREYRNATRLSTSEKYTVRVDMRALRKLYSYILAFSDQEKYQNAALIVDHMRKGIVQDDDLILSRDGLANYFALTESRQIIDNLIAIQRTLLASSNNDQMRDKLMESSNYLSSMEKSSDARENEYILQTKVGAAVKRLSEQITLNDQHSEYLLRNATELIDSILVNMKNSETNQVAQSQSELLAVMSTLKRSIDKPLSDSPELKNILEEINADPSS